MILLQRYSGNDESTLGLLFINGQFECYTIEKPDKHNQKRISRVPEGVYPLRYRKELTELTQGYRNKYYRFTWHLEVQEVPYRDYIYLHIANSADDVDGCIGLADGVNNNEIEKGRLYPSAQAFERVYKKISGILDNLDHEDFIPITIRDEYQIR